LQNSFLQSLYQIFRSVLAGEGPTILWGQLKDKKARTNDGKDLGEIKEVEQNYVLLGKGAVKKDKY
jgi:hypothetical protein